MLFGAPISLQLCQILKYKLSISPRLYLIWCYTPLLYGFLSLHTLRMVPQKGQYWPKSGSVSNDQHPKCGTRHMYPHRKYPLKNSINLPQFKLYLYSIYSRTFHPCTYPPFIFDRTNTLPLLQRRKCNIPLPCCFTWGGIWVDLNCNGATWGHTDTLHIYKLSSIVHPLW